jgi:hypothetical protein
VAIATETAAASARRSRRPPPPRQRSFAPAIAAPALWRERPTTLQTTAAATGARSAALRRLGRAAPRVRASSGPSLAPRSATRDSLGADRMYLGRRSNARCFRTRRRARSNARCFPHRCLRTLTRAQDRASCLAPMRVTRETAEETIREALGAGNATQGIECCVQHRLAQSKARYLH